jgi:hypothetical protein
MSISSISGGQAPVLSTLLAGSSGGAATNVAPGSNANVLVANVNAATSGVSAALQSLGSALGSIINTSA